MPKYSYYMNKILNLKYIPFSFAKSFPIFAIEDNISACMLHTLHTILSLKYIQPKWKKKLYRFKISHFSQGLQNLWGVKDSQYRVHRIHGALQT